MGPKAWALFTVCCVIGSGIGQAEAADQAPTVRIKLEGGAALRDLQRSRSIIADIYQEAGVELQWDEDPRRVQRVLTIVLTTRKEAPEGIRIDAMGVAPTPGDGTRGDVAYIFTDAVTEFASSHRVPMSYVVACAIAHEIGHLLLPPNAHRPDGIMRASWRARDFPPVSPGVLGFPVEQARLLKLRAQSR